VLLDEEAVAVGAPPPGAEQQPAVIRLSLAVLPPPARWPYPPGTGVTTVGGRLQ
jgi:hypothetical protein